MEGDTTSAISHPAHSGPAFLIPASFGTASSSRFAGHTASSLDLISQSQNPRQAFAWNQGASGGDLFDDWSALRKRLYALLCRSEFDITVGFVIVVDASITGLEVDLGDQNPQLFRSMGQAMLAFFMSELAIRIFVFRMQFFKSWINNFDLSIVVLGCVAVILGDILTSNNYAERGLKSLPVVRISRLLRAIRVVRISTQFRSLWMIVSGLKASIGIVLWTTVLLALACYCFGIVAVEFVAESNELQDLAFDVNGNTVGERFGSLPKAMLSLVEFFAIENVSAKGWDSVMAQPGIILFLMGFTLVVPIVLLNLITAVLVETAITASSRDLEHSRAVALEEWRWKCSELEDLFDTLISGSRSRLTRRSSNMSLGTMTFLDRLPKPLAQHFSKAMASSNGEGRPKPLRLTQEAVERTWETDNDVREHLNLLFGEPPKSERGLKRLLELWSVLDLDGDGALTMSEFCEGLAILYDILKSNSADAFIMLRLVQLLQDAKLERKLQREDFKDRLNEQTRIARQTNQRLVDIECKVSELSQQQSQRLDRLDAKMAVLVVGDVVKI